MEGQVTMAVGPTQFQAMHAALAQHLNMQSGKGGLPDAWREDWIAESGGSGYMTFTAFATMLVHLSVSFNGSWARQPTLVFLRAVAQHCVHLGRWVGAGPPSSAPFSIDGTFSTQALLPHGALATCRAQKPSEGLLVRVASSRSLLTRRGTRRRVLCAATSAPALLAPSHDSETAAAPGQLGPSGEGGASQSPPPPAVPEATLEARWRRQLLATTRASSDSPLETYLNMWAAQSGAVASPVASRAQTASESAPVAHGMTPPDAVHAPLPQRTAKAPHLQEGDAPQFGAASEDEGPPAQRELAVGDPSSDEEGGEDAGAETLAERAGGATRRRARAFTDVEVYAQQVARHEPIVLPPQADHERAAPARNATDETPRTTISHEPAPAADSVTSDLSDQQSTSHFSSLTPRTATWTAPALTSPALTLQQPETTAQRVAAADHAYLTTALRGHSLQAPHDAQRTSGEPGTQAAPAREKTVDARSLAASQTHYADFSNVSGRWAPAKELSGASLTSSIQLAWKRNPRLCYAKPDVLQLVPPTPPRGSPYASDVYRLYLQETGSHGRRLLAKVGVMSMQASRQLTSPEGARGDEEPVPELGGSACVSPTLPAARHERCESPPVSVSDVAAASMHSWDMSASLSRRRPRTRHARARVNTAERPFPDLPRPEAGDAPTNEASVASS